MPLSRAAASPPARPPAQVDIGPAFAAAANAAAGTTLSPPFSPYASPLLWLHGAYIFEDVGVTAYMGAAPFLQNVTEVLSAAAGILGVEAYHAGAIRAQLLAESNKKAYGLRVSEIVEAISKLRQKLGGGLDKGEDPASSLSRTGEPLTTTQRPTDRPSARSPLTALAAPPPQPRRHRLPAVGDQARDDRACRRQRHRRPAHPRAGAGHRLRRRQGGGALLPRGDEREHHLLLSALWLAASPSA